MTWFINTLMSSIGKKALMALTGIFLMLFLVVHLIGNLQLFRNDGGEAYNIYSYFMTHQPVIKLVSYLLYASILLHIIISGYITLQNRKARPVGYAVNGAGATSTWSSRNMGILGSLIFIFLVIHLQNFWYKMHWEMEPTVKYNGNEYKDLYTEVVFAFQNPWIAGLYVISMIGLAYHLIHGFNSTFQTLGIQHRKYSPALKFIGVLFAILVPLLFAVMPVYFYFR
jgi:succinate dehydrogenase / fumarate reductase cytochrome b subunit